MSQTSEIIEFIRDHGSITPKQAMERLGCYRLSGRIYDIKKCGIEVERQMITVPARDGRNARVAMYTIPNIPECYR